MLSSSRKLKKLDLAKARLSLIETQPSKRPSEVPCVSARQIRKSSRRQPRATLVPHLSEKRFSLPGSPPLKDSQSSLVIRLPAATDASFIQWSGKYHDHLKEVLKALKQCRELPFLSMLDLVSKQIVLPQPQPPTLTIAFDLDETLVYSTADSSVGTCVSVEQAPGDWVSLGVQIRPFAIECLRQTSKKFEILVFTAAQQSYADAILALLDPAGLMVHHRLCREHCVLINGHYIKDLRVLANRDISRVIMVDNSVLAFAYQLDNGVPMLPWRGDRKDKELLHLMRYLEVLACARDPKEFNRRMFKLSSPSKSDGVNVRIDQYT